MIEIRRLTPELADDYLHFFDITPHDRNIAEHKCYCVCWGSDDYADQDFSTAAKRREWAFRYIQNNQLQGYLAYAGGDVVGWCNANTKAACLKCVSWQRFMNYVPLEPPAASGKVKSVFCFVITPAWKRTGIATSLLTQVCQDAAQEGFDFVEAYPYQASGYQSSDFGGYVQMYLHNGFQITVDTDQGLVVRKSLH